MLLGLRFNENKDYDYISKARGIRWFIFLQIILTSLVPAVSGYIGFTKFGWSSPSGNIVFFSDYTALLFSSILVVSYLLSVLLSGWLIFTTRKIYTSTISQEASLLFAYYCSIPFVFASLTLIYPSPVINTIALFIALAYSIKLLYTGLYKISNIEPEKGFLYSSTILSGILIGFTTWMVFLTITYINNESLIRLYTN